jgi:proline iminopeptidase
MRTLSIIGSPGFPHPDTELREHLERNFDRSYYPAGFGRQLLAILASGSRVPLLSRIQSPTLVVHGADDPLVPLPCGMHTAEHIPGAELHVIKGMGHNLPPTLVPVLLERMVPHLREADELCPPQLADGIRLQHHDSRLLT